MSRSAAVTRAERVADVIGAVARQVLIDWGARRVALLDDASPEADLCFRVLLGPLGDTGVVRVAAEARDVEWLVQLLPPGAKQETAEIECQRLRARLLPDALPTAPFNKTVLLLGGPLPPEPFFPLGDLYASEVASLTGEWSAPPPIRDLVEAAGGIEVLDAALRRRIDGRDPKGLDALGGIAPWVARALERGRASRTRVCTVPKIGPRTLGVDLFE